jgi:hypothetical protein
MLDLSILPTLLIKFIVKIREFQHCKYVSNTDVWQDTWYLLKSHIIKRSPSARTSFGFRMGNVQSQL